MTQATVKLPSGSHAVSPVAVRVLPDLRAGGGLGSLAPELWAARLRPTPFGRPQYELQHFAQDIWGDRHSGRRRAFGIRSGCGRPECPGRERSQYPSGCETSWSQPRRQLHPDNRCRRQRRLGLDVGCLELGRPHCAAIGRHRQIANAVRIVGNTLVVALGSITLTQVPCPMETITRPRPISRARCLFGEFGLCQDVIEAGHALRAVGELA
jgi:hypothetical protein